MKSISYDLIGDIHGHSEELEALLRKMGYRPKEAGYALAGRKMLFAGDLIDRGPGQKRVVEIVQSMVKTNQAICLMGNHEFNAICYDTPLENGRYVRPRNEKNQRQHAAFLSAFPLGSVEHANAIQFFKSLPLWFENEDFRAIHACWYEPAQNALRPWLDQNFRIQDEKFFLHFAHRHHQIFENVELILKGPECELPNGLTFQDKDNFRRDSARVNWWLLHQDPARSLAIPKAIQDQIECTRFLEKLDHFAYTSNKPVFFGHYWLRNFKAPASDQNLNAHCLDYSIAKKGQLVACRLHGNDISKAEWFAVDSSSL